MERIYTSRNSEDWVTWNVTRLWHQAEPQVWWRALLEKARQRSPQLELEFDPADLPTLTPWLAVHSPSSYEHASRLRLRGSEDPRLAQRASIPRPVEGESEIDLILEGRRYLIFAEAKLHSDVSLRTTYDPHRNQIVRSIDYLLDRAGVRIPNFWMLVPDVAGHRLYAQVLDGYRKAPEQLHQALPHRPERLLDQVLRNLVLLPWQDLLDFVPSDQLGALEQSVRQEILTRVTGGRR